MAALEKAVFFDPKRPNERYYVQFNPNTLEYACGRRERKRAAREDGERGEQFSPLETWEQARLSMRLFFNTYGSERAYTDVRALLLPLRAFLCKGEERDTAQAPQVVFAWGSLVYQGSMDGFSVTYQMFAADGTPVQAEVSVSIAGEDAQAAGGRPPDASQSRLPADGGEDGEADLGWLFEE